MLTTMHRDINTIVDMVNELELIRRQLYDLRDVLKTKNSNKKLVTASNKLDTVLMTMEGKLVQLRYTGTGQDDVRYPDMLAGKIGYLAGAVSTADFAPADQHKEVYAILKGLLTQYQNEMDGLLKGDVAMFMKQLEESGIKPIVMGWKK